ncbi:MAG: hypothetical protein NVSMB64_29960 [Candidatus Velthaea sp.]
MSGERPAPDFAMVRAVEILASIATRKRDAPIVPPPPIDRPVVLFNERRAFEIGTTTRHAVERDLGTGFPYPAKGWHTYCVRFAGTRRLLSAIYRADVLTGVEFYVPKSDGGPQLAPRDWGDFRLIPGEVALGSAFTSLDGRYTPAVGGPAHLVYAQAYEIRFPGGLGYVMGNEGRAERLVLYAAS